MTSPAAALPCKRDQRADCAVSHRGEWHDPWRHTVIDGSVRALTPSNAKKRVDFDVKQPHRISPSMTVAPACMPSTLLTTSCVVLSVKP
jgi:hypothetical protein